jgi:hypothetical protein
MVYISWLIVSLSTAGAQAPCDCEGSSTLTLHELDGASLTEGDTCVWLAPTYDPPFDMPIEVSASDTGVSLQLCGDDAGDVLPAIEVTGVAELLVHRAQLLPSSQGASLDVSGAVSVWLEDIQLVAASQPAPPDAYIRMHDVYDATIRSAFFCGLSSTALHATETRDLRVQSTIFQSTSAAHTRLDNADPATRAHFSHVTVDGEGVLVAGEALPEVTIDHTLLLDASSAIEGNPGHEGSYNVTLGGPIAGALDLPPASQERAQLIRSTASPADCIEQAYWLTPDSPLWDAGAADVLGMPERDETFHDIGGTGGAYTRVPDEDGDGVGADRDCDDGDASVYFVGESPDGQGLRDPSASRRLGIDASCTGEIWCHLDHDCDGAKTLGIGPFTVDAEADPALPLCETAMPRDGICPAPEVASDDCAALDPQVHPDAPEIAGNALDEDCDGLLACDAALDGSVPEDIPVDEGCPAPLTNTRVQCACGHGSPSGVVWTALATLLFGLRRRRHTVP